MRFDLDTLGILEDWSQRRVGYHWTFDCNKVLYITLLHFWGGQETEICQWDVP